MKSAISGRANLGATDPAARPLHPQHLQLQTVDGVLPPRPDGPRDAHRSRAGPQRHSRPHHRNRGRFRGRAHGHGGGIPARRRHGDAISDPAKIERRAQRQCRGATGQHAADHRAAAAPHRRRRATLDRRQRPERRSQLGRLPRLGLARRNLLYTGRSVRLPPTGRPAVGAARLRRRQSRRRRHAERQSGAKRRRPELRLRPQRRRRASRSATSMANISATRPPI